MSEGGVRVLSPHLQRAGVGMKSGQRGVYVQQNTLVLIFMQQARN